MDPSAACCRHEQQPPLTPWHSLAEAAVPALHRVLATEVQVPVIEGAWNNRRVPSFLRQLLLDLCPALDAAGYLYWVDFGSLLGIHR